MGSVCCYILRTIEGIHDSYSLTLSFLGLRIGVITSVDAHQSLYLLLVMLFFNPVTTATCILILIAGMLNKSYPTFSLMEFD
ncbi:hypothetical protein K2173_009420 [Erythroxylum novogranatense]|uniref:Uncharacterized protein n=1 Tax=Erythroxylum novogranatense TaxID=1862640 RepID=A0AAV8U722_9ROSI|nr:hypothetical protein K2173_009420 [Erythroxylum novogranatense]